MGREDYLVVRKDVLPDYFEKVVCARELIRSGEVAEISEAVRRAGISRSTYYKYKDCVFTTSQGDSCRKAVISMILRHEKGTLGGVLKLLSENDANILTITQNPPIGNRASVVISMDISSMICSAEQLIALLDNAPGVERPSLIDMA